MAKKCPKCEKGMDGPLPLETAMVYAGEKYVCSNCGLERYSNDDGVWREYKEVAGFQLTDDPIEDL